jgi:SSS family solute:Na+ symporter
MVAALFGLPYNKRFSILAMLSGGILALTGKLMMTFNQMEAGQYVLVSGFIVNAALLFVRKRRETIDH